MKNISGLLILSLFLCVSAFALTAKDILNQTDEWVRVFNVNGEFSFEMPSGFVYFYDKDGFLYSPRNSNATYPFKEMRMFNASSNKTVMSIEIYDVSSPKKYMNAMLEEQPVKAAKIGKSENDYLIRQVQQNSIEDYRNKKDIKISHITRFIASRNHLYVLTVANRGAKTAVFESFLSSAKLNAAQTNPTDNVKTVNISSLTPISIEQIAEIVPEKKDDKSPVSPNKPIKILENPVLFLSKPKPSYTDAARNAGNQGVVRLRTTLSKDGRISKVRIISDLPNGLTRNAFFAALRIKFIPQQEDDQLISITRVVEYGFNIY